ncbi:MAG: iron chelate uptake ABC transporter family permease subunit, partial [Acetanaerobacterium sp.]
MDVNVLLFDGFETLDAFGPVEILGEVEAFDLHFFSPKGGVAKSAHGVKVFTQPLGEAQAALLGVDVERTKRRAIVVTAVAVGAVTATTGIIGFIGLIAPHWVRMVAGPDHRVVLP